MRVITIILLLGVCFFGGMSYGLFEKERHATQPAPIEQEVEQVAVIELDPTISEPLPPTDHNPTVHKTASFIEKIVSFFYEMVIKIMYKLTELFFD